MKTIFLVIAILCSTFAYSMEVKTIDRVDLTESLTKTNDLLSPYENILNLIEVSEISKEVNSTVTTNKEY